MMRCIRWLLLFLLTPGLCQANCLPTGRPFNKPPVPANAAGQTPSRALLFLDTSGSMSGFVKAGTEYTTVYRMLPTMLEEQGGNELDYYRVGKAIEPMDPKFFPLALSKRFYCVHVASGMSPLEAEYLKSAKCAAKFHHESRLDLALDKIVKETESGPINMAVLVTDMFLTQTELLGQEAAFRDAAGKLLRRGLSIAVIAVEAPFEDVVTDLPSYQQRGQPGPRHAGTRPFFILAFGATERIRALETNLKAEFGKQGNRTESVLFQPFITDGDVGSDIRAVSQIEPQPVIDPDVLESRRDLAKALRAVSPRGTLPTALKLPFASSSRWQPITAQLELPAALRDPTRPFAGRIEIADEETLVFSEGGTCGWTKVWNNKDRSLTTLTLGRIGIFQDPARAAEFERTTRGLGKLFLHRVALRWVPDPSAGTPVPPPWVTVFGYRPNDEREVLERLRFPQPGLGQKPTVPPTRTRGFFPALNLPELVNTLGRVERNLTRSIDLGYFVVAWRYEN